jgi:hypothetical protein
MSRMVSVGMRKRVIRRDGYACRYCGKVLYGEGTLTVDHVEPYSKVRCHEFENLVVACLECNRLKDDQSLEEVGFVLHPPRHFDLQVVAHFVRIADARGYSALRISRGLAIIRGTRVQDQQVPPAPPAGRPPRKPRTQKPPHIHADDRRADNRARRRARRRAERRLQEHLKAIHLGSHPEAIEPPRRWPQDRAG